ncbi:2,3-diaminopropionate biosynthesis protein SbnB [Nocardiopsis rhodophaea]|uniref:2,3-diaminopropionate biosynthesis protein SbnB n=1 Tax=Nocardiopsis rhodophaea TaxID=280238 RepID=A0ABP5DHW5_9ACTN
MRILGRDDVGAALAGLESTVLDAVRGAYLLHGDGHSRVPFSTFLRPPQPSGSRVIALPAHLGGPHPVMGLKWISSFPANVERGLQRASAVQILNDVETGYPSAVLEGSQVSAARTAASAALASAVLRGGRSVRTVGLVGCGTINHRVIAYLALTHPEIETVVVRDVVPWRAEVFAAGLAAEYPRIAFWAGDLAEALGCDTVSVATTDSTYWLDLDGFPGGPAGQVILHLSLRDLSTGSVLGAYNVVDDTEHAVREQTSLHRAEQQEGHREFVHAEIADLLGGRVRPPETDGPVVFSPFGLGILDLAVADAVLSAAARHGIGTEVAGFDPGGHRVTGPMADEAAARKAGSTA